MDRTANAGTALKWSVGSNPTLSASCSGRVGIDARSTRQHFRSIPAAIDCGDVAVMLRFGYEPARPDIRNPDRKRSEAVGLIMQNERNLTIFDAMADEAADITQEFWGVAREWAASEPVPPQVSEQVSETDFWLGEPTSTIDLQRVEVLDRRVVGAGNRRSAGSVDPLLRRLGLMVVAGALMVPVAIALRPSGHTAASTLLGTEQLVSQIELDQSTSLAAQLSETPVQATVAVEIPTSAAVAEPAPTIAMPVALLTAVAAPAEPVCAMTYTAGAGDSWYRVAEEAGISPGDLTEHNNATLQTKMFPGDAICLPAGSDMPSAPVRTTMPKVTATTVAAIVKPPTVTSPSRTTVEQIIRDEWPSELEEKALAIAWRESRHVATAFNGTCCYGLFQIYWSVHKGWLDDVGVYSSTDLLDARKNARAAYATYQRAGGWGPWGG